MPVVVVDADDPTWQYLGKAWVVEHPVPAWDAVFPQDVPGSVELDDSAGLGVVGDDVGVGADLLWVRWVRQRKVDRPDKGAGHRVFTDPRACYLGDQDVAVLQGRIAVRISERRRWPVDAAARGTDLTDWLRLCTDDQYSTIVGVRDDDAPIGELVGIVRFMQVPRCCARCARVAIRPERSSGGIGDLDDRVVPLLVGQDRGAVVDEEGVVRKEESGRRRRCCRVREGPIDGARRVNKREAIVAAIRDEELAAE